MTRPDRLAPCPQCRQPARLQADNPFRPFCSERCKLLDLGQWFAGTYALPAVEAQDEAPAPADQPQPRRLQ
jgi:endogenous inhibitor of DNA gyrase (YacG/DUF329 family)